MTIVMTTNAQETKKWYHFIQSSSYIRDLFQQSKSDNEIFEASVSDAETFERFWTEGKISNFNEKDTVFVLMRLRQCLFDHVTNSIVTSSTTLNQSISQLSDNTQAHEYHTLELDANLLNDQTLLPHFPSSPFSDTSSTTPTTPTTPNNGSASGKKKKASSTVERELRLLMQDHKPQRPWKKTDDEYINSLYDQIYRVWKQLNDSSPAEPFRKPVKKSQAKDYYEVISNPMDLSSIFKKIKSLQYTSKQEFEHDLKLMFDNCREYNTEPSEVLECCSKLEAAANELLFTIYDSKASPTSVSIPTPSAEQAMFIEQELKNVNVFDRDARWNIRTLPVRIPIVKQRQVDMDKTFEEQEAISLTDQFIADSTFNLLSKDSSSNDLPEYNTLNVPICDTNDYKQLLSCKDDFNRFRQLALNLGVRTREGLQQLLKLLNENSSVDLQTLISKAYETDKTFEYNDLQHEKKQKFDQIRKELQQKQKDKKTEKKTSNDAQPNSSKSPSTPVTTTDGEGTISPIQHVDVNSLVGHVADDELPAVPTVVFNILDQASVGHNVQQIFEIKKLKRVISEQQQQQQQNNEILDDSDRTFWDAEITNTIDVNDTATARSILRSTICMFLSHEGFDGASGNSLNLFTDILDSYMIKFGKVLNYYTTLNTNNSSLREAMMKAVQEMGHSTVSDLYEMRNSVESRIETTHNRLLAAKKSVESYIQKVQDGDTTMTEASSATTTTIKREDDEMEDEDEQNLDLFTSSIAFGSISDIVSQTSSQNSSSGSKRGNKRKREESQPSDDTVQAASVDDEDLDELIPIDELGAKKSKRSKKKK